VPFVVFAVRPQDEHDALAPSGIVTAIRRVPQPAGSILAGVSIADGFMLETEGPKRDELLASVADAALNPTATGGSAR